MPPCKINIIGEDSMSWILNNVNNTHISLSIQPFKLGGEKQKRIDNWSFLIFLQASILAKPSNERKC